MFTAIHSLNNVIGAEYWLIGFLVCALIFVLGCLLFKQCRTPKGIRTIVFSLLLSEIVCDIAWYLIYYPAGNYHNYGIGGVFVLLLWPVLLLIAGIITVKRNTVAAESQQSQ